MPSFTQPDRKDWKKTTLLLALYITAISAGAFVVIGADPVFGFIACLILVLDGLLLLVGWVNRNFGYQCRNCGHEFEISLITNLVSPHGMGCKHLKCPSCGQRTRAKVLKKQ